MSTMKDGKKVEIKIRVDAEISERLGTEFWDIVDVIYEDNGLSLGDIGVLDFNAFSDFPETIFQAVVRHLSEYDSFEDDTLYLLSVEICDGGARLGQSFNRFYGREVKERLNSINEKGT